MERSTQGVRLKNAQIFYRILPTANMHWDNVKILKDMKTIYVRYLQELNKSELDKSIPKYWKFDTDGIFYNHTQDDVYNSVMGQVLDNVVEGCNAVVLAFGQTGSGKSLTTAGLHNSFNDRGVAPRLLENIFNTKILLSNKRKMCIRVSCIETNRAHVRDLLSSNLEVLDPHTLKNVTIIKINSVREGLQLLFRAEGRRTFSQVGSKNHTANGVITFHVHTKPVHQTDPVITSSKIHIVDLAGSDSYGNPTSLPKNHFDVGNANLAKSQLEQFIITLCQNIAGAIVVKQKLNVLIQYLGDSLNAHSILRFIGHIRINLSNLPVTLSMLRFGYVVCKLKPQKIQQNISTIEEEVQDPIMQSKLEELNKERDLNAMITNETLSSNITQERIKHMQNVANEYLNNKTNEIVLINVTDATTVLKVFKNLFENLEIEKEESVKRAYNQALEDARRCSSKTDSLTGSRKLSKRIDNTSNDDLMGRSSSAIKSVRKSSIRDKSKLSSSKPKTSDHGMKSLKRSRTSSAVMKRSSTTKRKSNSSTATGGTILNESILEEDKLPNEVPDYEEAWQLFIVDSNYNYDQLMEALNICKEEAKLIRDQYLSELHSLHKDIEILEHRKNESRLAESQRLFKKQKYDENGNPLTSNVEQLCKENLQKAHSELLEQQENVLKTQTDFQVALASCKNCQNQIDENFERFCREKYQVEVPKLDLPSVAVDIEETIRVIDLPEEISLSEKCKLTEAFDCFRELMEKEIKRYKFENAKNKKWVQSSKI